MDFFKTLYIGATEKLEDIVLLSRALFLYGIKTTKEGFVIKQGKLRAEVAALRAWKNVPAYRKFLLEKNANPKMPFNKIPETNKENYVKKYSTDERCVSGSFLKKGVMIDESSGSTGTPFNWVRGSKERKRLHKACSRVMEWWYGTRPSITINAFSMGAWSTGVNVGEAMARYGVVKSTGPDLEKILYTLKFFGPCAPYMICGYPPFIKLILDSMIKQNFPIEKYELHALLGGEGMSEEYRRYILRYFKTCVSGYGASDLEMGIGLESPESIYIRGLLYDHPELRSKILGGDHRIPMIFQYNPLAHYIETNEKNELIMTLNYSGLLSPRIRYNIGDEGMILSRAELLAKLHKEGYPVDASLKAMPLPYLFLFGRYDQTVSVMGANIYPEDVERAIYAQKELEEGYASFMIEIVSKPDGGVYPKLYVEWFIEEVPKLPIAELANGIENKLIEINSDFKNAKKEYPEALRIELEVHGRGHGPFEAKNRKIKNRYIGTSKN